MLRDTFHPQPPTLEPFLWDTSTVLVISPQNREISDRYRAEAAPCDTFDKVRISKHAFEDFGPNPGSSCVYVESTVLAVDLTGLICMAIPMSPGLLPVRCEALQ